MTAGELFLVIAAVLCCLAFAALTIVLLKVLDALRALRRELDVVHATTVPLLAELRASADDASAAMHRARGDLDRFDRVLGSAEAISGVAKLVLSGPAIKTTALATGTSRAVRRLRRGARRSA